MIPAPETTMVGVPDWDSVCCNLYLYSVIILVALRLEYCKKVVVNIKRLDIDFCFNIDTNIGKFPMVPCAMSNVSSKYPFIIY